MVLGRRPPPRKVRPGIIFGMEFRFHASTLLVSRRGTTTGKQRRPCPLSRSCCISCGPPLAYARTRPFYSGICETGQKQSSTRPLTEKVLRSCCGCSPADERLAGPTGGCSRTARIVASANCCRIFWNRINFCSAWIMLVKDYLWVVCRKDCSVL